MMVVKKEVFPEKEKQEYIKLRKRAELIDMKLRWMNGEYSIEYGSCISKKPSTTNHIKTLKRAEEKIAIAELMSGGNVWGYDSRV
jgi:hypothetical protein